MKIDGNGKKKDYATHNKRIESRKDGKNGKRENGNNLRIL